MSFVHRRDHRFAAEIIHRDKGNDFIVGTFHIELGLGVLIRHAQGLDRRRARMHDFPAAVQLLAQAFRPKLAVPIGHPPEVLRIRHHHRELHAFLVVEILKSGISGRGIFFGRAPLAALAHHFGASEQLADINAGQRRGD